MASATTSEMVAGLRAAANWLEAAGEFDISTFGTIWALANIPFEDAPAFRDACRKLGTFEKDPDDWDYRVLRKFGPVSMRLSIPRSKVCRKTMVTKEVLEWVCEDSLLDPTPEVLAEQ